MPIRQLLFSEGHIGRRDTCIAKDKVDSAELLGCLLEDTEDYVLLGDVTSDVKAGALMTSSLVEQCGGFLKLVFASASDSDIPAGSR